MFKEKVHNEACTYGLFLTLTGHEDDEWSSDFMAKLPMFLDISISVDSDGPVVMAAFYSLVFLTWPYVSFVLPPS